MIVIDHEVYHPAADVQEYMMEKGSCLYNSTTQNVLVLNETGSKIWNCLEEEELLDLENAAAMFCQEYEISRKDSVCSDIASFVALLSQKGLVQARQL